MARSTFGGFGGDQVSLDPAGNSGFYKAAANYNATGTFWGTQTGTSTPYTDLIDPVTSVALAGVSTDAHGHVVPFKGPNGITEGWLDFGGGRFKVTCVDPLGGLDANVAAQVNTTGSATDGALKGIYTRASQIRGNGFMAFGDSISTAYLTGAGGAGYGAAWGAMTCVLSNQRLNYLGNAGVAGNTTTQMLARIQTDVLALNPQVVTVLGGTNDLTGSVAFATWSGNIKTIAKTLRAAGIRVILCTIPPRGNTTYLATQVTWNRWLKAFAQANGYDLLDFFGLLVDPTTGMYKTGYDSGDNLHPSQSAHIVMANYVIGQLTTAPYTPVRADTVTDAGNLIANPLLTAGSPVPTSFTTGGTTSADYTEGLVTDSDFLGKAWQVAYTSAASASNFRSFTSFTFSTGFSVGDTLAICFREKVTVASGITPSTTAGLRLQVVTAGGGSITPVAADGSTHAAGLHWFKYVVPASTTAIQLAVIFGAIPVGASFTALVGEFGVFNLSTMASTAP